jgi:hypothetical protein
MNLTSAGGIESGAVENQRGAGRFEDGTDFSIKVIQEGIAIIEAVAHTFFSIGRNGRVIKSLRPRVSAFELPRSMLVFGGCAREMPINL